MNIRLLGAHNSESKDARPACVLIDNFLAIDAGGLISGLTFSEQLAIEALLVTHHHYDHIKDIPMMGMNFYVKKARINIYSIPAVYEALAYLFGYPGKFYTNFLTNPPENPTINFTAIEPLQPFSIKQYQILPVPMKHSVPSVGYQITTPQGRNLFYSGDTGNGLEDIWQHISPDLLIIEVTVADGSLKSAKEANHLTLELLKAELISFRKIKGYMPKIITVHMSPQSPGKELIEDELKRIAVELNADIVPGYEGMQVTL
ncbi:MAG: MBL fold metallo-hydrolase [Dehalococcoidales bacterium]